jgi:hypothetical protein
MTRQQLNDRTEKLEEFLTEQGVDADVARRAVDIMYDVDAYYAKKAARAKSRAAKAGKA